MMMMITHKKTIIECFFCSRRFICIKLTDGCMAWTNLLKPSSRLSFSPPNPIPPSTFLLKASSGATDLIPGSELHLPEMRSTSQGPHDPMSVLSLRTLFCLSLCLSYSYFPLNVERSCVFPIWITSTADKLEHL
ncbi:hypothetical protein HJG60_010548 [Phyllostomus discolor]|uniref:Uncharacterized protein n=1 Tax=Phyllostomus discolor TaxID=89673 RepID=A0A834ANZ0_9CHIR|nr:hypothetical protein HJG60_010548 [Phyllostomus discolor]